MKPTIINGQTGPESIELTSHQKLARDIFKELIEINTTQSNGSTKAVEALAKRLRAAGFSDNDILIVGPRPQNMNLVVRYRGNNKFRPILFFGHLDVVEARREDWSFDPFVFLEKDGYFYGRGTSDMKCEDADIIANFIRLKEEGFTPDRDIIVALTEHEEGGDANGMAWLLKNRRDLVDAEFAINMEGGGGNTVAGQPKRMEVQTSEKIYADYKFEVHSKGGHSALPSKDNAIYRLAGALIRLSQYKFPVRLNETTRTYFKHALTEETGQTREDIIALLKEPIDTAAADRLAESSPYYNAMLRTISTATMLNAGHAQNALPQTAIANINVRMLPDDSPENVTNVLKSVVADTQVKITCEYVSVSGPISPLRKDIMDAVENLTSSMWPGVKVTPVMSTGATDGKYLRKAGIPVYGVSGIFFDYGDTRAHGKDERVGVKEFYNGVEFMYRFIKTMTSGT